MYSLCNPTEVQRDEDGRDGIGIVVSDKPNDISAMYSLCNPTENNHKFDRSYRKRDVDEDIKIIDIEKDGSGKDRESNRGRDRDGERSSRDNLKLSIPGRTGGLRIIKKWEKRKLIQKGISELYLLTRYDYKGLKNIYGYAQVVDSNASAAAAIPKYNGVAKLYFEEVDTEYPLKCHVMILKLNLFELFGIEEEKVRDVYEFFSKAGKADNVFTLYSVGGTSKNSWTCVCAVDGIPKVAADRPNSTCFSACKCTTGSSMKRRR
ncbi:hypothetical protein ACFE04_015554 [Oxalis oulophora]